MSTNVKTVNRVALHLEHLTPAQHQAMLQAGILPTCETIELQDGLLVRKDLSADSCLLQLTVEQYRAMIDAGILPDGESVELLEGLLVRKDCRDQCGDIHAVGPRHTSIRKRLLKVLVEALSSHGCHFQSQLPITIPGHNEPQPDLAVMHACEDEYLGRNPVPSELLLVIEVAHNSLELDRLHKQRIYAEAEVPEYWIVNLHDDLVEVYRSPNASQGIYLDCLEFRLDEVVSFRLEKDTIRLPVASFVTVARAA
ncbi:Uma2 family endonuclease [Planctomicrobium piriforme]|uniref:Endonuclease, Uma2 family (Restriction endonuclease fold) n=1 Tax=Planctomicrobium piriforme TaxID=1576369 RepID=A0A1I3K316_9PLAN|nr:Uma2 family endonuclease [Planctomicrobium piriforme]SFI66919.1 Endonuclease, Uma2 family (restriction endonuclease fold) [Planctomicrobium piriforme]